MNGPQSVFREADAEYDCPFVMGSENLFYKSTYCKTIEDPPIFNWRMCNRRNTNPVQFSLTPTTSPTTTALFMSLFLNPYRRSLVKSGHSADMML